MEACGRVTIAESMAATTTVAAVEKAGVESFVASSVTGKLFGYSETGAEAACTVVVTVARIAVLRTVEAVVPRVTGIAILAAMQPERRRRRQGLLKWHVGDSSNGVTAKAFCARVHRSCRIAAYSRSTASSGFISRTKTWRWACSR